MAPDKSAVERLSDRLWPESGPQTKNIKIFRGTDSNVTTEQIAEQILSAMDQIADGRATLVEDVDFDLA